MRRAAEPEIFCCFFCFFSFAFFCCSVFFDFFCCRICLIFIALRLAKHELLTFKFFSLFARHFLVYFLLILSRLKTPAKTGVFGKKCKFLGTFCKFLGTFLEKM